MTTSAVASDTLTAMTSLAQSADALSIAFVSNGLIAGMGFQIRYAPRKCQ